jgi:hypothetical protein
MVIVVAETVRVDVTDNVPPEAILNDKSAVVFAALMVMVFPS